VLGSQGEIQEFIASGIILTNKNGYEVVLIKAERNFNALSIELRQT
jgi:hypothetical protein